MLATRPTGRAQAGGGVTDQGAPIGAQHWSLAGRGYPRTWPIQGRQLAPAGLYRTTRRTRAARARPAEALRRYEELVGDVPAAEIRGRAHPAHGGGQLSQPPPGPAHGAAPGESPGAALFSVMPT